MLMWQDGIPDQERTGLLSIHVTLRQLQLRWSGRPTRMGDKPPYGDFTTGVRRRGGQKRRVRAWIGLVGQCIKKTTTPPTATANASTITPAATRKATMTTNGENTPSIPPPTTLVITVTTPAAVTSTPATGENTPDATPTTIFPTSDNADSTSTCPHWDRTFTSRISLVGHLRIHRTDTDEPVHA
ncbi:hypothetical protein SprV_0301247100 [Sparganum proliferum]